MAAPPIDEKRIQARFVGALCKGWKAPDAQQDWLASEVAAYVLLLQLVRMYPPDQPGWHKPTLPKSSLEKIVDAGRRVACGQPTGRDIAAMCELRAAPLATLGNTGAEFMVTAGEIARLLLPVLGAFPRS